MPSLVPIENAYYVNEPGGLGMMRNPSWVILIPRVSKNLLTDMNRSIKDHLVPAKLPTKQRLAKLPELQLPSELKALEQEYYLLI